MTGQLTILTGCDDIADGSHRVTESSLGAEFLGWEYFGNFKARYDDVGFHHVRWPGGIPAENGQDVTGDGVADVVYDLSFENIVDWRRWASAEDREDGVPEGKQREGLSDMLRFATQNDLSFAMIVPTARYVEDIVLGDPPNEVFERIRSDISTFVERLLSGEFGEVPKRFTLEVGSEYYATDVWHNYNADPLDNRDGTDHTTNADLPKIFGQVFATIADQIHVSNLNATQGGNNPYSVDLNVAVQVGRFQSGPDENNTNGQYSDNQKFIEQFEELGALDAVDSLIWHRYVTDFDSIGNGLWSDINGLTVGDVIADWENATASDLDFVGGWLSPAASQASDVEFGAAGLTNILQLFSGLVSEGMTIGSIYALGFNQSGSLAHKDQLFIGGQLFGMMSQALPGMHVVNGFQSNTGNIREGRLIQSDDVDRYVFEDDSKVVIYLAAKDFLDNSLQLDLSVEGRYESVSAVKLYEPVDVVRPDLEHIGTVAVVSDPLSIEHSFDGSLTTFEVVFQHDYEVIELTLTKAETLPGGLQPLHFDLVDGNWEPETTSIIEGGRFSDTLDGGKSAEIINAGSGSDTIFGNDGDDWIIGGNGKDKLSGNRGSDRIEGGAWHDSLYGGSGDDWLFGGRGKDDLVGGDGQDYLSGDEWNDTLYGGPGNDILIGGAGQDEVYGGSGIDVIVFEDLGLIDLDVAALGEGIYEILSSDGLDRSVGVELVATSEGVFDLAEVANGLSDPSREFCSSFDYMVSEVRTTDRAEQHMMASSLSDSDIMYTSDSFHFLTEEFW